jgi:hypothetical protein
LGENLPNLVILPAAFLSLTLKAFLEGAQMFASLAKFGKKESFLKLTCASICSVVERSW